jgi:hypothetical protein
VKEALKRMTDDPSTKSIDELRKFIESSQAKSKRQLIVETIADELSRIGSITTDDDRRRLLSRLEANESFKTATKKE